jgi:hypothetical protein
MNPQGTHNLQVLRGLVSARSLLSCTPNGTVDLWQVDDGSGRQVWNVSPVDDFPAVFNITVSSGTNPGKQFLSCTRDGATVDLFDRDDGSGRQRWRFVAVAGARICNYANVVVDRIMLPQDGSGA